jgi:hypothetical protein
MLTCKNNYKTTKKANGYMQWHYNYREHCLTIIFKAEITSRTLFEIIYLNRNRKEINLKDNEFVL